MEIHELNTFSGTPSSGDYLATDNGSDTSKISITEITNPLNARIDNIISSPAPSAQEVADGRLGADGVTYDSLGSAIRTQITNLQSDLISGVNDVVWEKGGLNADGGVNRSANAAFSQKIYLPLLVVLGSDCRAVVQVYKGSTYIGKINASGGVDPQSGNWKWFTGTFSVSTVLNSVDGDTIRISVHPTNSDTISSDADAQTYGDGKVKFYVPKYLSTDQFETEISAYRQTQGSHIISPDNIDENCIFYATQSNNSPLPTKGNGFLETVVAGTAKLQIFYDYSYNAMSWRYNRGGGGWFDWNTEYFGKDFYYINGTIKQFLRYESITVPLLHQDIAVYNNKLFATLTYNDSYRIRIYDLDDMSYQDYLADIGHGNGIVFGQTVAEGSDYPLLYSSSWDDGNIHVLKFTGTTFVLVDTIQLPVVGYTTCAVDDINKIAYIFYIDELPVVNKPYTFIAYNYDTETELYRKLTEPFETMQGIDLHNGVITVMSGYYTEASQKLMRCYDVFGNKVGEYIGHPFIETREPEGFSFDPVTYRTFMSDVTRLFEIKNN